MKLFQSNHLILQRDLNLIRKAKKKATGNHPLRFLNRKTGSTEKTLCSSFVGQQRVSGQLVSSTRVEIRRLIVVTHKKEATKNNQIISYKMHRTRLISPWEHRLLCFIASYSNYCDMKQAEIAELTHTSVRTIRRAMKGLLQKGLITRRYRLFKRCVLSVVTMDIQNAFLTGSGLIKQAFKAALNLKKNGKKRAKTSIISNDRPQGAELNGTSETQSTRETHKKETLLRIDKNLGTKQPLKPKPMSNAEFIRFRDEQVARAKALLL